MERQVFFLVLLAGLSGCVAPTEDVASPSVCEGRGEGWTCVDGELHGVCLAGACVEAPLGDVGLEHVDGQCFALAVRVYPASYAWCEQAFGGVRPVPFACMYRPPMEACEPIAGYADRFCCCDPAADAACAFYK